MYSKGIQDSIRSVWILCCTFWIPGQWKLDSGIQLSAGFRIPLAELQTPMFRIPDSTSTEKFGGFLKIRITLDPLIYRLSLRQIAWGE